jgi:hypothetical protein
MTPKDQWCNESRPFGGCTRLCVASVLGGGLNPTRALEWVHYHAAMGMDAFFLMLVAPSPELLRLLMEVQDRYQMRLVFWRNVERADCSMMKENCKKVFRDSFKRGFPLAMSLAKQASCDWAAFLDTDEYITPTTAGPGDGGIRSFFLNRAPEQDWVYLRWVWIPVFPNVGVHSPILKLHRRISDSKASRVLSDSGKSVVRPWPFRDVSHWVEAIHETPDMPNPTTVHGFTPIDFRNYQMSHQVVPTTQNVSNGKTRTLPGSCAKVPAIRAHRDREKCTRLEDVIHLRHYRRFQGKLAERVLVNRDHSSPMWPDSADSAELVAQVLAPAHDEVCRRMHNTSLAATYQGCAWSIEQAPISLKASEVLAGRQRQAAAQRIKADAHGVPTTGRFPFIENPNPNTGTFGPV